MRKAKREWERSRENKRKNRVNKEREKQWMCAKWERMR